MKKEKIDLEDLRAADQKGEVQELLTLVIGYLENYIKEPSPSNIEAATQLLNVVRGQAAHESLADYLPTYQNDPTLKSIYQYCAGYSWWQGVNPAIVPKDVFVQHILQRLDATDLAAASLVSPAWRQATFSGSLWEHALARNFPAIYAELKREEAGEVPAYDRKYPDWQKPWNSLQWKKVYRRTLSYQLANLNPRQKELFKAIKRNHRPLLDQYLPNWQDLWACESRGKTLIRGRYFLELVTEYEQIPWLQSIYSQIILLPSYRQESGINAQGVDLWGVNLLHWAVATAQNRQIIGRLIQAGCNLSALAYNSNNVLNVNETRTPLYVACELGYAEQVMALFQAGDLLDVNQTQKLHEETALIVACIFGHESVVTIMLAHPKITVNKADRNGDTPLIAATRANQKNIVILLLKDERTEVNAMNGDNETALYKACQNGNVEIVQALLSMQLIEVNPRVNFQNETPLIRAVIDNHPEVVNMLLHDARTLANLGNSHQETAFVLACKNSQTEIVKVMLTHREKIDFNHVSDYGTGLRWACIHDNDNNILQLLVDEPEIININQVDGNGNSAFHETCGQSRLNAAMILLTRKDLTVNLRNNRGETALWQACELNRHVERDPANKVLAVILKMRPDIDTNQADENDTSPLLRACDSRYPEAVQLLLSRPETNVNQADNRGITPLISLCEYTRDDERLDRDKALEILLKCGQLEVNKTNDNGQTALHVACHNGDIKAVTALLSHPDIRTDIADENGLTPLQIAMDAKYDEVVAALESKGTRPHL